MNDTPAFLRPLWRRVALVAFCVAWSAFEFYNGATGWGTLVAAMAVYGAWLYLYDYKDGGANPPGGPPSN